jgi:hypothetical protein
MKSVITVTILLFSTLSFSQTITQKTFDGNINGKIPILLTLNFDGGTVFGNVVYKKKGIPISVIGEQSDGSLYFHELMPDGQITGKYLVKLNANKLTGKWFGVKLNAKDFPMSLIKTQEQSIPQKSLKSVTGGEMLVQQIGNDKIAISFNNVTAAPAYNMATIEKTVLKYANSQAIFSNQEYGKCKFKIRFLENGARVNFMEDAYDCGFGHNASTEGNYIRVNSSVPKFDE